MKLNNDNLSLKFTRKYKELLWRIYFVNSEKCIGFSGLIENLNNKQE